MKRIKDGYQIPKISSVEQPAPRKRLIAENRSSRDEFLAFFRPGRHKCAQAVAVERITLRQASHRVDVILLGREFEITRDRTG